MSQQYNCLMELYTNCYKISLFMKMHLPSSFTLRYVRAEMNVHAFMNELDQKDIQEKLKIVKIYVQSQWRVVLLWYHIFWQSSIQRGRHTQLCIITSLKWIIQICSNFYWWVSKIAFYTHPIHIVVWGNFPFKCFKKVKTEKWQDLQYSFPPIGCCVRINHKPDGLLVGDIQS